MVGGCHSRSSEIPESTDAMKRNIPHRIEKAKKEATVTYPLSIAQGIAYGSATAFQAALNRHDKTDLGSFSSQCCMKSQVTPFILLIKLLGLNFARHVQLKAVKALTHTHSAESQAGAVASITPDALFQLELFLEQTHRLRPQLFQFIFQPQVILYGLFGIRVPKALGINQVLHRYLSFSSWCG